MFKHFGPQNDVIFKSPCVVNYSQMDILNLWTQMDIKSDTEEENKFKWCRFVNY